MKSFFLVLIVSSSILFQLGCGRSEGEPDVNQVKVPKTENNTGNAEIPSDFASATDALAQGNRLFDSGETEKAIDVLLQAVQLDPDLAEAHFKLGIAYALIEAQDNSVSETVETTTDSRDKKTKETKTNSEKAFANAVTAYKEIVAVNKEDDGAHFHLGLAYNKLNEDDDAAKAIREAVRLKPDDTLYQTELGAILIKLAKYHEAVTALKKAIELDSGNVKAEELLEKAEAGRKRIDFVSVPKDDKKSANSNANTPINSAAPASNTAAKPANTRVAKPPPPAKTPK